MRNFKKILAVLVLILMAGSLTACSRIGKVSNYFEDQGYVRYQYNNRGDSLIFALHDDLADEYNAANATTETVTTSITTTQATTTSDGEETTLDYEGNGNVPFVSYVFSNGENAVVVIEFASEDYLWSILETSEALLAEYDGLDPADYVNGNCLLVVLYPETYEAMVEIFQGRAEPLENISTVAQTTFVLTEETTTQAD